MRFVITAEPAPVPSFVQFFPPSALPQRPACATPAMIMREHGFAETMPRFPHSDGMFARLPVAFTQVAGGATTFAGALVHSNDKGVAGPASTVPTPPVSSTPPEFLPEWP